MKKTRLIYSMLTLILLSSCSTTSPSYNKEGTFAPSNEINSSINNTLDVEDLIIARQPEKTVYVEGECFDATGLRIDGILSDGSIRENINFTIDEEGQPLKAKTSCVTVSYDMLYIKLPIKVRYLGNADKYSVSQTEELESRPLEGKTFFFLGSSVTFGANSEGESMAEFIAKRQRATSIKKAISGTTLRDIDSDSKANELEDKSLEGKSYIYRLNKYLESEEKVSSVDAFVLQLSTNDATTDSSLLGEITGENVFDKSSFNQQTTIGAIEYILSIVKEAWNCPVLIWSNPRMVGPKNSEYKTLVENTKSIASKWNITFLNMFENQDLNNMNTEEKLFFIPDTIHPTKAGYRDKWVPLFEEKLTEMLVKD